MEEEIKWLGEIARANNISEEWFNNFMELSKQIKGNIEYQDNKPSLTNLNYERSYSCYSWNTNVGKSTLYNRLTASSEAIVDDISGVTRYRKYGRRQLCGRFWLIDSTGGYVPIFGSI